MSFTYPAEYGKMTYNGTLLTQYINDQSLPQKTKLGEQNMDMNFKTAYGSVPEGFVGRLLLDGVRIWEGTTVHDSADDALKESRKLLMTRMAKLFE